MELMGIVGIIVNCALIGQSGQVHRMFPNITSTQTIILVVILEVVYQYFSSFDSVTSLNFILQLKFTNHSCVHICFIIAACNDIIKSSHSLCYS